MAREKDGDSAISLFSFQDIITSITGIMFLVVLLLMLMMLTSHIPQKNQTATASSKELQKELLELKEKIKALQASQKTLDDEINKLKKLSPEELERLKELLRQQIRDQQEKLEVVRIAVARKKLEQQKMQPILEKLSAEDQIQSKTISTVEKQLAELTPKLKKLEQEMQIRKRVMKFSVKTPTSRKPVIAELGKDGVKIIDINRQTTLDLRVKGDPLESIRKLENHLSTLNNNEYYFSLAIKPAGFKHAYRVIKVFSDNNFERGLEILPDDNTSLSGEQTP